MAFIYARNGLNLHSFWDAGEIIAHLLLETSGVSQSCLLMAANAVNEHRRYTISQRVSLLGLNITCCAMYRTTNTARSADDFARHKALELTLRTSTCILFDRLASYL